MTLDQIEQLSAARSQREGGQRLGTADSSPWQYHPELASLAAVHSLTLRLQLPAAAPGPAAGAAGGGEGAAAEPAATVREGAVEVGAGAGAGRTGGWGWCVCNAAGGVGAQHTAQHSAGICGDATRLVHTRARFARGKSVPPRLSPLALPSPTPCPANRQVVACPRIGQPGGRQHWWNKQWHRRREQQRGGKQRRCAPG
mgnify:CR=1 FL=1